jgi:uncharacterized damage-inducible protein DinB
MQAGAMSIKEQEPSECSAKEVGLETGRGLRHLLAVERVWYNVETRSTRQPETMDEKAKIQEKEEPKNRFAKANQTVKINFQMSSFKDLEKIKRR